MMNVSICGSHTPVQPIINDAKLQEVSESELESQSAPQTVGPNMFVFKINPISPQPTIQLKAASLITEEKAQEVQNDNRPPSGKGGTACSCDRCRKSHLSCDRKLRIPCSKCAKRSVECTYSKASQKAPRVEKVAAPYIHAQLPKPIERQYPLYSIEAKTAPSAEDGAASCSPSQECMTNNPNMPIRRLVPADQLSPLPAFDEETDFFAVAVAAHVEHLRQEDLLLEKP